MHWYQPTLKDVFWSVSLLAAGIACISYLRFHGEESLAAVFCLVAALPLIGAGVLAPFRLKLIGAGIGVVVLAIVAWLVEKGVFHR